ncbi:transcriptional regulator [Xylanibacillus composti]|uniref:Transcriptional regulator n=1 Tax=Xylanibacillus composti TaxID=1572762 RepID=A0A8J4H1L3_9BACL|nr:transcriptional regulator [Xylanibacillus composti]MDT9724277.1 transcriptional regulator [Xylanibacillus composti]GIQ69272.1 hypothetical protein XYCOK13_20960 [Xylanibacillus composti]
MNETKLHKDVFRHVEAELYAYPLREREMTRLREEILTPFHEESRDLSSTKAGRLPGDPTGQMAVRLAGHAKLMHMERVSSVIEQVYNQLPEVKQEFVRVKYWTSPQRLTAIGVCQKLHISERTYSRWRRQFVQEVAEMLGWN